MIQQNPTTETAAWPGYTPEDLAWFAQTYGDIEWAVHVIGPDDVHVNEPDAQGEHNPDGKPLTEQTAWALADSIHKFNAWYRAKFGEKPGYTEDLIPNVFHRGVLVEARSAACFRADDLVEITGRGEPYTGKTGIVVEVIEADPDDDAPEYPIGLDVDGFAGLVWCGPGEIRYTDPTGAAVTESEVAS